MQTPTPRYIAPACVYKYVCRGSKRDSCAGWIMEGHGSVQKFTQQAQTLKGTTLHAGQSHIHVYTLSFPPKAFGTKINLLLLHYTFTPKGVFIIKNTNNTFSIPCMFLPHFCLTI